jgi:hypothetical protein
MKRIVFAALLAAAGAPSALASVCSPHASGHYYAIIDKFVTSRAEHGAAINLETTTLSSGAPGSQFVNHEMWYGVTGNCTFWVEVGEKDGITAASGPVHHQIFWADNRANGLGYHEHFPAIAWNLGSYYQLRIAWVGNNSWNIYFGGVFVGTSTRNFNGGSSRCLEAGIEATRAASTDHVGGRMYGWQRKDRFDRWNHDWDGISLQSDCPADIDVNSSGVTTEVLHGPN